MAIRSVDGVAGVDLVREPPKPLVAARDPKPLVKQARPSVQPATPAQTSNSTDGDPAALEASQQPQEPQKSAQRSLPDGPSLRFHVDQDTGKTVVALVGTDGKVVRQMPTEEALELAKAIGRFQGMFVDLKV